MGIRVHFVTIVTNTGNVPVELEHINYEMRSPAGVLVEVGTIPRSYPKRIAPGQSALIGRTVTADGAVTTEDVASIRITFDSKKVDRADRLLLVQSAELHGANSFGQVEVVGVVANDGATVVNSIKVAVAIVDRDGQAVGYATAKVAVNQLRPGDFAEFITAADLPADRIFPLADHVLVFASDE